MKWEPVTHSHGWVALAHPGDGAILLGQATTRHLRLSSVGVEHRDLRWSETPPDEYGPAPATVWSAAWSEVVGLDLEAATSDRRRPALLPTLVAVGSEALGLGTAPDSCDAVVAVRTRTEEYVAGCDGCVCQGYRGGDVAALRALLGLLLDTPGCRSRLADPFALLAVLAEVAEATTEPREARELVLARWAGEAEPARGTVPAGEAGEAAAQTSTGAGPGKRAGDQTREPAKQARKPAAKQARKSAGKQNRKPAAKQAGPRV